MTLLGRALGKDNGSCYIAKETVAFGYRLGLDIRTTPVYSPESNGLAEAFVKTFKRDYAWFGDLKDAKTVMSQLPHWFEDYNEKAPHKALKMSNAFARLKITRKKRLCATKNGTKKSVHYFWSR